MASMFDFPGMQAYVICAVVLVAKMFGVAFATSIARAKSAVTVNPEDTKVLPGDQITVATSDSDSVLRFKRAHMNDLENIPIFLIIGLIYVWTGAGATACWIYFGVFTAARVLHTVFYAGGIQPWRTASYATGALATLGLMLHILRAAL